MAVAIEMWFSEEGDRRVRRLWSALEARGLARKKKKAGAEKAAARFNAFAKGFLSFGGIDRALKEAASMADVHGSEADFDADKDVIGVANGVLDLRSGDLRPMTARDRITRRLAVSYDAAAQGPRWEKFLTEVFVDEDGNPDLATIEFVRQLIGYGLTGIRRSKPSTCSTAQDRTVRVSS